MANRALPGAASADGEAERHDNDLFLITRMLDRLHEYVPRELVGPTKLLELVIRNI